MPLVIRSSDPLIDLHACTASGNLPIALLHDDQPLFELFRELIGLFRELILDYLGFFGLNKNNKFTRIGLHGW